MSEDDSDSGNNSNQIATSLDTGDDIQVAGPSLINVPSGGISTFEFTLENLGPFDAGSTKYTLPVPPLKAVVLSELAQYQKALRLQA